jgi:hypothetical protein
LRIAAKPSGPCSLICPLRRFCSSAESTNVMEWTFAM